MLPRNFIPMCCIATTVVLGVPAQAELSGPVAAPHEVCAAETAERERETDVPRGLLTAIARTESGRWQAESGRTEPWPWTVTSGGEGRFFATKAEAVAEVEILLTRGITNVDVGCMQINMHHHWNAFETLEEAFDPAANVAYAATYLEDMRKATRSWEAAAGRYHSATPARARYYRGKVLQHWRDIRTATATALPDDTGPKAADDTETAAETAEETAGTVDRATADAARMAELNAAFQARRQAARMQDGDTPFDAMREKHLERWRTARTRQAGLQQLLALRQAELERKRQELLEKASKLDRDSAFSQRRRQQLEAWRSRIADTGDS